MVMVYLDEQSIQQLIDAFNRRDLESGSNLFTENVISHCPGRNRISGDYLGKTSVIEFWQKQIALTGETFRVEIVAVSLGEGMLILIMDISAEAYDQRYSWRRVNHYRVVEGRVVEGWIYEGDQYSADTVFA